MTKLMQEKSFAVHWILSNCKKNFCLCVLKVLKKAIAQNIRGSFKSTKTAKGLYHVKFVASGMYLISYCWLLG